MAGALLLFVFTGCGRFGFAELDVSADADPGPTIDARIGLDASTPDAASPGHQVLAQDAIDLSSSTPPNLLVHDVISDDSGNIYLTGAFSQLLIGDDDYQSDGSADAYIASFDSQLQHRWVQTFGNNGSTKALRLFWRDAHVYTMFEYNGSVSDSGVITTTEGLADHLLLKLTLDGQVVDWAAFGSQEDDDLGRGLFVDANAHVYTGGACNGPFDYGGGPLIAGDERDPCFAHLDQNMDVEGAWRLSGSGTDAVRGLGQFPNGDLLVLGYFSIDLEIGQGYFQTEGERDAFVARFDDDGNVLWAHPIAGLGDDLPEHVVIDDDGNVYIALSTTSSVLEYGTQSIDLDAAGSTDGVVLSLKNDSTLRWATALEGAGQETIEDIALLADGTIGLAGGFQSPGTLGNMPLDGTRGHDLVVGILDPTSGATVWAGTFGSGDDDRFLAVDGHPGGGLVAAGYARGPVDFGTGPIGEDNNTTRALIVRLQPD